MGSVPRWAKSLGEDGWERLHELLHDGWDTSDIMRELEMSESKRRSLQVLAQRYGPRRRLKQFAAFKDALAAGAMGVGPNMAEALSQIAEKAVSPSVKESTQRKAADLLVEYAKVLRRLMQDDEQAETTRKLEEHGGSGTTHEAMVNSIRHEYDMPPMDGADSDG